MNGRNVCSQKSGDGLVLHRLKGHDVWACYKESYWLDWLDSLDSLDWLPQLQGVIFDVQSSEDGQIICSGCYTVCTSLAHRWRKVFVSLYPPLFALVSDDRTLCLWNFTDGSKKCFLPLPLFDFPRYLLLFFIFFFCVFFQLEYVLKTRAFGHTARIWRCLLPSVRTGQQFHIISAVLVNGIHICCVVCGM